MTLARIARQISSVSTALTGPVMTTAVAQTSGTRQQVPAASRPATSVFQSEPGTPLVDTLNRTRHVPGRRALLLISTGLDTFSHATFDDVIATAERADTPVYSIGLAGRVLRTIVDLPSPLLKIDWSRANNQLKTLAKVSNGRTYLRDTLFDITAIYDDLMEHLRLRYVIRYFASATHGISTMRRVRVSLIDPRTRGPLRVTDAAGKAVTTQVSADASYTP
jgi:Ca-activated chloride channel homolog